MTTHGELMNCTKCNVEFEPTAANAKKHYWWCASCRLEADRQYRQKRKDSGNPVKRNQEARKLYEQRPEVVAKNALRTRLREQKLWRDPEGKIKRQARRKAQRETQAGRIVKSPCAKCGDPKVQIHHPDYSQPLLIVWLCSRCHRDHHRILSSLNSEA